MTTNYIDAAMKLSTNVRCLALEEVEAIVLEKQREFFEGLDPEWGLCRRILAEIKKLPRESA